MKHLYLFTLEVTPLEVGRVYDELPSHLTLMSRFYLDMLPDELIEDVYTVFAETNPIRLSFGATEELGPKRVMAHMVDSLDEIALHNKLCRVLDSMGVEQQYPQFIGDRHKAHVTSREGVLFTLGDHRLASAVYLIEVVDKKRLVRAKFELGAV